MGKSNEQEKKKEVNWQPSVDNGAVQDQILQGTGPEQGFQQDPAETAGLTRPEFASKTEPRARQTGTVKRKKNIKVKEQVLIFK